MLLASNSLSIRRGTPLPAVPTFRRRPCSCVSDDQASPCGSSLARRLFAVEQPHRLHEQAAQRLDAAFLAGRALVAAALHEAQVGLALAQQAQVVGRALAGQQHHLDAVARPAPCGSACRIRHRRFAPARWPASRAWAASGPATGRPAPAARWPARRTARPRPAGRASTAGCSGWPWACAVQQVAGRGQMQLAHASGPAPHAPHAPPPAPSTSAAMVPSSIMPGDLPARPVPSANSVSPSDMVCTGLMLRARPSCPTVASREACALVMTASVAITPIVVLVPASSGCGRLAAQQRAAAVEQRLAVARARARDDLRRVADRSRRRAHCRRSARPTVTPSTVTEAVPMPPFIARSMPKILPTVAPVPAPTLPCAGALGRRQLAGAIAGGRVRPDRRVAHHQVEQHGAGHERQHAPAPTGKPTPCSSSQRITPVAASRPQALPPASRMRVHAIDHVGRRQQVGFARAGRRAAHIDTRHCALARDHHAAAGGTPAVGEMADLDAGDVGDGPAGTAARGTGRCRSGAGHGA